MKNHHNYDNKLYKEHCKGIYRNRVEENSIDVDGDDYYKKRLKAKNNWVVTHGSFLSEGYLMVCI